MAVVDLADGGSCIMAIVSCSGKWANVFWRTDSGSDMPSLRCSRTKAGKYKKKTTENMRCYVHSDKLII